MFKVLDAYSDKVIIHCASISLNVSSVSVDVSSAAVDVMIDGHSLETESFHRLFLLL